MRDFVADWLPIAIVALVVFIVGGTLIYILSSRFRQPDVEDELENAPPPVYAPQPIAEGVDAIQSLGAEVRALREAVHDLGNALRERPAQGAPASLVIPHGQPVTIAVRGITGLDKLVDLERVFERFDAVQTVGIQSYRQGRGEFVVTLNRPLVVDAFRSAVASGIGGGVNVDGAEPDRGRLELRIESPVAART